MGEQLLFLACWSLHVVQTLDRLSVQEQLPTGKHLSFVLSSGETDEAKASGLLSVVVVDDVGDADGSECGEVTDKVFVGGLFGQAEDENFSLVAFLIVLFEELCVEDHLLALDDSSFDVMSCFEDAVEGLLVGSNHHGEPLAFLGVVAPGSHVRTDQCAKRVKVLVEIFVGYVL